MAGVVMCEVAVLYLVLFQKRSILPDSGKLEQWVKWLILQSRNREVARYVSFVWFG